MILCADIGGTSVKLGLVDREGRLHASAEASVSFDHYHTPIIDTVLREGRAFLEAHPCQIEGIGVSATGQVDSRAGAVIGTNGKIANYEGTNIKQRMEEAFCVPCEVLNDANAALLGETFCGGAVGAQNVVMLTLGTGVGGGVLADGRLLTGHRGIAGEMGHFTLYQDGVPCPCGKKGCYESYASTTALLRAAEKAAGEANLNGRVLFDRLKNGDPVLQNVLDKWLDDVAAGITGLIHIFNPELVLIGGGVSRQEELLLKPLKARVLRGAMPRFTEALRIERAVLGNDAGLIGAAKFYLDLHHNPERM